MTGKLRDRLLGFLCVISIGGCSAEAPRTSSELRANDGTPASSASPTTIGGRASTLTAVPRDYVHVPGGYTHPSCIHPVPDGATVGRDGNFYDSTGTLLARVEPCKYAPIRGLPEESLRAGGGTLPAPPPHCSGPPVNWSYVDTALQQLPTGATTWNDVRATLQVPTQAIAADALYYYWNGFYNCATGDLVQAVLSWGSVPAQPTGYAIVPGTGPNWALSTWSWANDQPYVSTAVPVNPGDLVVLENSLADVVPVWPLTIHLWEVSASDFSTGQGTGLVLQTGAGMLTAYSAVFEPQFIFNCPDSEDFFNLELDANQGVDEMTRIPQPNAPQIFVNRAAISCFFGVEPGDTWTILH